MDGKSSTKRSQIGARRGASQTSTGRRVATATIGLGLMVALVGGCSSGGKDDAAKSTTTIKATTTSAASSSTTSGGDSSSSTPGANGPAWNQDSQANRAKIGETFTVACPPGGKADTVWGAGVYTDDSSICTAAVQSGLITFEKGGKVTYEVAAAEQRYASGVANGVTSVNYGAWGGSFTFPDAPPGSVTFEVGADSWSQTAQGMGVTTGKSVDVACSAGGGLRSVWGSGPYTADSSICTAAVHAGLLVAAEGGTVTITGAAGLASYEGTTANGVTSSRYGSFGASFVFAPDQPADGPTG